MSIFSDRTGEARFAVGVLPYLISVGLAAAAIIVLFCVASISLLHIKKETLTGSRIDYSPVEDKFIGRVVSYTDSKTAPVPVQTKSPSSSEANDLPSSTPIPPPSGMSGEETAAELALKPTPDREGSTAAAEIPHGSTRGPSTEETPPPELSGSQEVRAQPASIAEAASAAHGSTRGPSTEETPPPELNGLNTREGAAQTRTETFPKSSVRPDQTTTKYHHRRRHEIDGTALAGETVDANPAARRGVANAFGCPASAPCVNRGTAPFTAPTATPEYDEAGAEVKGITFKQHRGVVPPAPAPPTDVGRVTTRQGANIRDLPTGSAVLGTVPRGTTLHVFARRDGWVQVGDEVPMGWVYSSLVKDAP